MQLNHDDVRHLRTGALFLACAADPDWCDEQTARTLSRMDDTGTLAELVDPGDLADDDLIVAVGYVNNGLPLSELRPVGDEFLTSLRLVEEALGRPAAGIMPLAAANINGLVPVLTGIQRRLPVVDADPMGRVFPLLHQSVFTLAGVPAGPVGATGALGESAMLDVGDPLRAERLTRALADQFGGWSATALYPVDAAVLAQQGIRGTVSRMIRIGRILDAPTTVAEKHATLRRNERVRRIIRARVVDIAGISRPAPPGQPDTPSSALFVDEAQGRLVQVEIQNELLLVMLDGSVVAAVPDIITMLRPDDASVASLDDLWVGNVLDLVILPAPAPWYSERGMQLAGPAALHLWSRGSIGGA